jgi:hypothetical protein
MNAGAYTCPGGSTAGNTYTVHVWAPSSFLRAPGDVSKKAVTLALQQIQDSGMLGNDKLVMAPAVADASATDTALVSANAAAALSDSTAIAIVGVRWDDAKYIPSNLIVNGKMSVFSMNTSSIALSDSARYPWLLSMIPHSASVAANIMFFCSQPPPYAYLTFLYDTKRDSLDTTSAYLALLNDPNGYGKATKYQLYDPLNYTNPSVEDARRTLSRIKDGYAEHVICLL